MTGDFPAARIRRKTLQYLLTFVAGLGLGFAINGRAWMIGAVTASWGLGILFGVAAMGLATVRVWSWLIDERSKDDAGNNGRSPQDPGLAGRRDSTLQGHQRLAGERTAQTRRVSGVPEQPSASAAGAGAETKAQPKDLWAINDVSGLHESAAMVGPLTAEKMERLVGQLIVFLRGVPIRNLDDVEARVSLLHATFLPAVELHRGDRARAIETIRPAYDAFRGSMLWTGEGLAILLAALERHGIEALESAVSGKAVH